MHPLDPARPTHVTRRQVMFGALATAGVAALPIAGCSSDDESGEGAAPSTTATSDATGFPQGALTAAAAATIDPSQFLPVEYFEKWDAEAVKIGLRATGSTAHEQYVADMAQRLRDAGVTDVTLETVPLRQWLATDWSLAIGGTAITDTFYVPYTTATGPEGLTAEMVWVEDPMSPPADLAGKIAVFDLPRTPLSLRLIAAVSYPDALVIEDGDPRSLDDEYDRPYQVAAAAVIDSIVAAGAAGLVGIWDDLPGEWAKQYIPYDGVFRDIPGLWVDRDQGATVRQRAAAGETATLVLEATVRDAETTNVIGYIPGRTDELTMLHTHTDGTNAVEENGPIAVVAAAQYLARLPQDSLERTVIVFLSSGHFTGGSGIRHWLDRHRDDIVPRVTAGYTVEHLGTLEMLPDANGDIVSTGLTELAATFSPDSRGLVDAMKQARADMGITGSSVTPYTTAPSHADGALREDGYPGEGTYLYSFGDIRVANFITGPVGLLVADLDTTHMVDYDLMHAQAMAITKAIVTLAGTSTDELAAPAGS